MKTIFLSIFIFYCLTGVIYSQSGNVKGPYFGQTPPGDTPRLFVMPAIASQPNFLTTRIAFSPDGKECFFSGYNDWSTNNSQLYYTKCIDSVWTFPVGAPFFQPPGSMCSHPFFSSDGNRLYFSKNADIWVVDRTTNGWGNPKVLPAPINTSSYEGTYSQTTGGTAYVESWRPGGKGGDDIWQVSGLTQEAVNLGPTVNSGADDGTEFITSDGRYLLFFSTRTGGREDLYVTFRKANGSWTVAVNLNQFIPGINTVNTEYAPKISPDGHYLFFTYIDHDAQQGGIYWVSARNIDSLKNINFPPYVKNAIPEQTAKKDSLLHTQAVYVDSYIGADNNAGTENAPVFSINKTAEIIRRKDNNIYVLKINPGIYILNKHVSISTEKDLTNKRIVIEANVLPDDTSWTPEKMPIIINTSKKGEIPGEDYSYVISFLINESHVTIRGIKFHGYSYPNTRYFPIARLNKSKTDLLVEQCMFIGDKDASHIQVGVIAHGNEIKVDHCIFYNAKNSVVFWEDAGDNIKHGNSLTNSIIVGAFQSAVWTSWPDKDFKFANNIVSNCKHVWVKNDFNTFKYSIENCIIVNNQYYTGVADNGVHQQDFDLNEKKVIKEGFISLRLVDDIDKPFPIDYLHIVPNTLGYDLGAGLFKKRRQ